MVSCYSVDIKSVQVTEEVLKPLYEDLNTPGYIANLHKLYESANKGNDKELYELMRKQRDTSKGPKGGFTQDW